MVRLCSVSYTHLDVYKRQILVIAVSTGATTYVAIAGGMLIILAAITVSIIYKKKKQN